MFQGSSCSLRDSSYSLCSSSLPNNFSHHLLRRPTHRGLQKSASLATASPTSHLATATEVTRLDVTGLGTFPPEVEATMRRAMEDPNRLGGRALMELVRTIFSRCGTLGKVIWCGNCIRSSAVL